jgi:membrane-associated phospholipid phosphatase
MTACTPLALPLILLGSLLAAQDQPLPEPADTSANGENLRPGERDVSLDAKKFGSNLLSDQKMIWTFPAKLVKGKHLVPTFAVVGVTAGLVFADPSVARAVRRNNDSFGDFNNALSTGHTTAATLLTPAAFYAAGLITKDTYLKRTGLLAAEAWVDTEVVNLAFRSSARRLRPLDVPVGGNFSDTWFKTTANPTGAAGSFPSGHTAWAFAVATVVARRHGNHKWVPIVAYALASLDAASRISSSKHFVSDTAFGAALGYVVGRFVVLRE